MRGKSQPQSLGRALSNLGLLRGVKTGPPGAGAGAPQGRRSPALLRVLEEVGRPALRGRVASWGLPPGREGDILLLELNALALGSEPRETFRGGADPHCREG